MLKRNAFLLGSALSLTLSLPGFAEDTQPTGDAPAQTEQAEMADVAKIDVTGNTVLATVNGDDITLGHLIVARQALSQQYQSLPNDVLIQGLLEQVIQQTVLGQAMGELSRRAEIELENQRRSMVATEKVQELISTAVTEEALQMAYDEVYAGAEPTQEFRAAHILVETKEEALDLIKKLSEGADFTDLAKEFSTGPSGPNGGDLGWFGPGMMVKPFEDAVLTLDPGQVSDPVETQFGWHVVKLMEERMKGAPPMEEVREELVGKIENDAVEQAVAKLLEAAKIERVDLATIDADAISNQSLLSE